MDNRDRSIVAQVCLKVTGEVYASLCDVSQGFQPDLFDAIYRHAWKVHDATMKAGQMEAPFAPPPQTQAPPVDPMQIPPPPPFPPQGTTAAPPPAPPSQPVAQPSAPQPVLSGPPCPNCQTPTVLTKDYAAKKARNLSEGKKAPPMWRCPLGSYDWNTKTPQGCQGSIWEPDPVATA